MTRAAIFAAVKAARGRSFTPDEVPILDVALDRLGVPKDDAPGRWRISDKGLALIKRSEGLRLKAYLCPAGIPTIGYGSTGQHVRIPMSITEAEAERLLLEDLERFEKAVNDAAKWQTQGQYDAAVSLAFNIGIGAFQGSSVLRKHKAGDHKGAAAAFLLWNKGGGRVLPGLVTRRADEAALYLGLDK